MNVATYFVIILASVSNYVNGAVVPPKIKLNDGVEMPTIGLGTWLGNTSKAGNNRVEQAVIWAIDAGYRHIDTAYIYRVEDQVGRGLMKKIQDGLKREELYICSKLWNDKHARSDVVPALRRSLADLQLDYVDLYLIHWPAGRLDVGVHELDQPLNVGWPARLYSSFMSYTPQKPLAMLLYKANGTDDSTDYLETWRGMMDAKALGLTRSIGLSNFNEKMMERILANGLEIPAVLQVEINLTFQQPELLAFCREKNITVVGYTPFGSLFQSEGQAPPPRANHPALVTIASKYQKTVAQIALRYLFELGVIPIPKSEAKSRIEQNINIFDFELTAEEKETLKNFDKNYRIWSFNDWIDHPYYPFEESMGS